MNRYLQELQQCIHEENGVHMAPFFSYQHKEHAANDRILQDVNEQHMSRFLRSPWDELTLFHLRVCVALQSEQFKAAHKEQSALVHAFTKYLQVCKDENWMLPVLNVTIRDLRLLSIAADLELKLNVGSQGIVLKPHQHMEKAADLLMGLFRICATDLRASFETSKRLSMMNIINQLFKIYFKINKLHLCKPLIRALENAKMGDCFSMAQRVTYNYFLGMKSMFDGEYKLAEQRLSFAFYKCHVQSRKNKRLVLIFLIPVKMLLGKQPSARLLQEYDLMQFSPVVHAVRQGNLRSFDQALEQEQDFFWTYGIYLILEKLKIIAYRNVFKRVCLISKTHQIPVEHFRLIVESLQGEEASLDEVHCILANLIYEGKIKGYISLQHQKLVISKQNPFPNLATVSV